MSSKLLNLLLAMLIGIALISTDANATTHFVPGDYATIQEALNSAVAGDTVVVAEGKYQENITFKGKDVVLTSTFLFDRDVSHIRNTIIDGSQPADSNAGSVVRFTKGEGPGAQIIGFTLTGGIGTRMRDQWSEAVFFEGGGIIVENSSPVIMYNWIVQNHIVPFGLFQGGGGGIRAGYSSPTISNNVIAFNGGQYGTALVLNVTSALVSNNIMVHNYGAKFYGGGAIWIWGDGLQYNNEFNNNVVMYNRVADDLDSTPGSNAQACGLFNSDGNVFGQGNIFYGNDLDDVGVEAGAGSFTKLDYSLIGTGSAGGTNQLREAPEFVDADLHLMEGSVLVDGADPAEEFDDPESMSMPGQAMSPALGTVRGDIGAYGGPLATELPTFGLQRLDLGEQDQHSLPARFELAEAFPNPFNASTTIRFNLERTQLVNLTVYDVMGRRIQLLQQGRVGAGNHVVSWTPGELSSGVYFLRLEGESQQATKRLVLVK